MIFTTFTGTVDLLKTASALFANGLPLDGGIICPVSCNGNTVTVNTSRVLTPSEQSTAQSTITTQTANFAVANRTAAASLAATNADHLVLIRACMLILNDIINAIPGVAQHTPAQIKSLILNKINGGAAD